MKLEPKYLTIADHIYKKFHGQYRVLRIECSDFKGIPSDNDFMIDDPIKITKLNSKRIAAMILVLSYFTHYNDIHLLKAR